MASFKIPPPRALQHNETLSSLDQFKTSFQLFYKRSKDATSMNSLNLTLVGVPARRTMAFRPTPVKTASLRPKKPTIWNYFSVSWATISRSLF